MAMNIIQLQDNLKNLSDQQLTQAMQMPSQDTPPFLVVSELNRRKKMRDSFQAQQASQNQTTVAQDVVAAAGVPQQAASEMAQSLAPQTDMTNNTGIMSVPQGGEPQRMAAGGVVKMWGGGNTPVGDLTAAQGTMTYADFIAAAKAGKRPTWDQYAAAANSLNDQQAADIQAMLDDPTYVPQDWEQSAANAPGVTPTTPAPPQPSAVWDWAAGAFGGRTLGEQQAIDAERAAAVAAANPDAIPLPHPGQTGDAAAKVVAAKQAAAAKAAADAAGGSGGTGGSGGSGGAGGGGKPSTYEQMLMDAMTNADKKAKQDKWLALAQMGLSLMSSAQPNIGMALGEAGAKGIEALQGARDRAESEKLGLSKELYGIDLMRQKMAASSAAAAAKGKGSGLTANQTVTAAAAAVNNAEGRLGLLGINPTTDLSTLSPDAQLAAQTAINDYNRAWSDYQSILAAVNAGISAIPSGASEDPTAPDNVSD